MPEPSPEIWPTILPLAGVVLGGIIGWGGAVVTHWLSKSAADRQHRRAKLEELVGMLCALEPWVDCEVGHRVYRKEPPKEPAPLGHMEAICALYFADLKQPMSAVKVAVAKHILCALDLQKVVENPYESIETKLNKHDEYPNKHLALRKDLMAAVKAFTEQAAALAKNL